MIDEDPRVPLEPYPCEKIVYRAAIFSDWIRRNRERGKQISNKAFFRFAKDDVGVTVAPTPESCIAGLERPTHGIIAIKVGWLRDAGFDVIPDREDHANIIGLPIRTDDTLADSSGLASKIAKLARPYDPPV